MFVPRRLCFGAVGLREDLTDHHAAGLLIYQNKGNAEEHMTDAINADLKDFLRDDAETLQQEGARLCGADQQARSAREDIAARAAQPHRVDA